MSDASLYLCVGSLIVSHHFCRQRLNLVQTFFLSDELREHLKNAPKMIMTQNQEVESSDSSSSSSSSSDSSSSDSSSESDSDSSSSSSSSGTSGWSLFPDVDFCRHRPSKPAFNGSYGLVKISGYIKYKDDSSEPEK